jgi:hypothetical protein
MRKVHDLAPEDDARNVRERDVRRFVIDLVLEAPPHATRRPRARQ